jgi:hypothetical protein
VNITRVNGLQTMEICLEVGFDWKESVGKNLPGCPEWCPVTHFGYLRQGTMKVYHEDGSEPVTVNTGDTYNIGPGHRPEVLGSDPCIMVEFSQDPTLTATAEALTK